MGLEGWEIVIIYRDVYAIEDATLHLIIYLCSLERDSKVFSSPS